MVKFRLAKKSDFKQLAEIHLESGRNQPGGFMFKLGILFFKKYYSLLLNEKHSVILVAEEDDSIIGFCSGTLDANEHLLNLKSNRLSLLFYSLPKCIQNPKLLLELYHRDRYISGDSATSLFNSKTGVRNEYWGWRESYDKSKSPELFRSWMDVVYSLGYESFRGEVDSVNKSILLFHKFNGANVLDKIELKDGRTRYFVEYKRKK